MGRRSTPLKGKADLRTSYERIRDLGARLLKAQDDDVRALARELHDDISQQMALLEIDLELCPRRAEGEPGSSPGDAMSRAHSPSLAACTNCRTACIRPGCG